ncbi:S1 RNA-binding domain-containing protein [Clostridium paridis]|uniref:DNA-binding protein n=1 Tax=Clostridium paridis TaxID=2803863 RepID=A0A937FFP7_9CLOT|nr:S1-like domain-containing RNA-binding protein [Clostridium paridis]MBL4932065.1 DNA-binding protein [Clostridium paridis]
MIKLGEYNELKVVKERDFGIFVTDGEQEILIPKGSLAGEKPNIDEIIKVFIYRDSEDRIIGTLKKPLGTCFEISYLKVVDITSIGAFADIGIGRDVLIPLKEQLYKLHTGQKYLLYLYIDKTGRIAATTDVDDYLEVAKNYNIDDEVTAVVYEINENNTLKLAVDNKYKALMLKNEYYDYIPMGEELKLRIRRIYEDGTLGLTTRKRKLDEREVLIEKILKALTENGGSIPFNDKSNPEDIRREFNTSKNYFKMTLGALMKQGKVYQDETGTHLKQ